MKWKIEQQKLEMPSNFRYGTSKNGKELDFEYFNNECLQFPDAY